MNKYYWHFTRTSFYWEQANRLVTTGGQPQFNTPAIKQIKIPVPSIDVQKQIINILDNLEYDTLKKKADALLKLALKKGGYDNVTIVIVKK